MVTSGWTCVHWSLVASGLLSMDSCLTGCTREGVTEEVVSSS